MDVFVKSKIVNILTDELHPQSFGHFIDMLIIENIRMWHAQEIIYEPQIVENFSRDEMFAFLKKATWLNLRRNYAMDGLDNSLAEQIVKKHPNIERLDQPISMAEQFFIWEEV